MKSPTHNKQHGIGDGTSTPVDLAARWQNPGGGRIDGMDSCGAGRAIVIGSNWLIYNAASHQYNGMR